MIFFASVRDHCFGNQNVNSACENFVETMEAESLSVSSHSFNIPLFTCSRRLMKIVLRCQNQDVFKFCQKTYRGENHPKYRAAYSANCFFQQTCFASLQRKRQTGIKEDFWGTGASVQTGWRHFANKTSVLKEQEQPSDDRLAPKVEQH